MRRGGRLFRGTAHTVLVLALLAPATAAARGGAAAAGPGATGGEPEGMTLKLIVHRPGMVRLDGRDLTDLTGAAGAAPVPWRHLVLQWVEIPAGRHRLTLRPDDPLALPPWEEQVVVGSAGDTVTAVLGRPLLDSSPSGAAVRVAGEPLGSTPVAVDPGRLPSAAVTFELPDYRPVTVGGDSLLAVSRVSGACRVELQPMSPAPIPARIAPEAPRTWWGRHRRTALAGSLALLAGGVYSGLRFKDRADRSFDAYLETGNRQRQHELFGEAERFDRLALAGWTIAEAALLTSFFLLIHETPRAFVPTAGVARDPASGATEVRVGLSRAF